MEGITKMIFGLMAIAVGSAVGLIAIWGAVSGPEHLLASLILAIAALIVTAGFRFWQHE